MVGHHQRELDKPLAKPPQSSGKLPNADVGDLPEMLVLVVQVDVVEILHLLVVVVDRVNKYQWEVEEVPVALVSNNVVLVLVIILGWDVVMFLIQAVHPLVVVRHLHLLILVGTTDHHNSIIATLSQQEHHVDQKWMTLR